MTQSTDSRQLRLLIDGVLEKHGIYPKEYPMLALVLTDAVKRFVSTNNGEPARTREQILAGIKSAIEKNADSVNKKQVVYDEINKRVGIRPVGIDWEDFIDFCIREEKKGKTVKDFITWWLADEWQRDHPPTRPDGWYVKWDLAFEKVAASKPAPQEYAKLEEIQAALPPVGRGAEIRARLAAQNG